MSRQVGPIPAQPVLDRRAFILAETEALYPPLTPEIVLRLASEAVPLWQKTEEELGAMGLPPPFWAFAWAGGQALARYILDQPEMVRGKTCLDFATGSGLVAIAAMKAGAASVTAVDIDAFAVEAAAINAAANEVVIEIQCRDRIGEPVEAELILAGDVCYDRDLATRLTNWLEGLAGDGRTVLIGDPGRAYLPKEKLTLLASYEVPVTRDLEDAEIKRSRVWRLG